MRTFKIQPNTLSVTIYYTQSNRVYIVRRNEKSGNRFFVPEQDGGFKQIPAFVFALNVSEDRIVGEKNIYNK